MMRSARFLLLTVSVVMLLTPVLSGQEGKRPKPREGSLKVGDAAPDFELNKLDSEEKVKLSSFKDKKPVVLIFGSYT